MQTKSIKQYFILISLLALTSCFYVLESWDRNYDKTDDERYWGGYKPGAVYLLLQDCFFHSADNSKQHDLVPEKFYDHREELKYHNIAWPSTLAEYRKSPEKYPEFKVINKETHFKCTKILLWSTGSWCKINVYGLLLDGDFSNTEVYLNHISAKANESPDGAFCLAPLESYLKIVN